MSQAWCTWPVAAWPSALYPTWPGLFRLAYRRLSCQLSLPAACLCLFFCNLKTHLARLFSPPPRDSIFPFRLDLETLGND